MKRKIHFTFLLFFFCCFCGLFSQNTNDLFVKYNKTADKYYELNADSSLKYSLLCSELAKKINNDTIYVIAYVSLGNAYAKLYEFNQAVNLYLKALKISEEKKIKKRSAILGNIGNIYMRQEKYNEGFYYFKRAYQASIEENNVIGQVNTLNQMCDYYNSNGNSDSSLALLKRALQISKKHGLKDKISYTYDNIANSYFTKGETTGNVTFYKTVELYADTALRLHEQELDSAGIAFAYGLLGATNIKTGNYAKAENYYFKFQELSARLHDILNLKTGYEEMSDLYRLQKKFDKAYECRVKYDSINKLYLNEISSKQVSELNTKYETDKKAKENQLLQIKNNLSDELIKRQNYTVVFIILILIVLLITSIFIYKNLRSQKKANHIIAAQKDEVELQKNIVEEKNTEITDSIRYAKRIQNAILTSDVYIKKHLNDYFILYKPKDIVSGDFYWTLMHTNKFFIVTADCTGHGVPGAMMSMLGINLLNQIVAEKNILEADAILNNLRREIIKAINPEDSQEESKDGMDCSLLIIDLEKMNLEYACANNAFYLVRNNSLIKYDADRMPVGKSPKDTIPFRKHSIQLQKNDLLITTTDGFTDQFGGANGKKLKSKKLEQLILENHNRSLPDIKTALNTAFVEWKGDLEQVDDVTVIGIRI